MHNLDRRSRVNKYEKRRKNTNFITIFMVIGALLIIILLGYWLFSDKDDDGSTPSSSAPETENNDTNNLEQNEENEQPDDKDDNNSPDEAPSQGTINETQNDEAEDDAENDVNNDMNTNTNEDKNNDIETNEIDSSDDENVESAYTGNWQPIGTEQAEPHETMFSEDTVDWEEMKQAIALAAGLEADEMIIWFIGNGGEQKAIGTVSPSDNSKVYRVYISWITNEGWQPTKVEILKENDFGKKAEQK